MTPRRSILPLATAIAVIVLMWILAMPPTAGPDEPGHQVRSAALVRGQLDGTSGDFGAARYAYEVPAWIGFPDPGCYAFQPTQSASCAAGLNLPEGEALLGTRSGDYPVWGHLLPGLGTFGPADIGVWLQRILDALVPVLLVSASLLVAARRGWAAYGSSLLALTPMAWFSMAVVNPSGLVIAGGFALWTALLTSGLSRPLDAVERRGAPTSLRLERWLFAAGWAAMVLPRRDGLVWAAIALSLALLIVDHDARRLWRTLRTGPQVVVVGSTLVTLAWAATSSTAGSRALFLAPLAPVAALALRRVWRSRFLLGPGRKLAAGVAMAAVGLIGAVGVMSMRADGFDRAALRAAVGQTGIDLQEAIGILGWLDAPVPATAVDAWVLALGALAGATIAFGRWRSLIGAASVFAAAVLASWILTMVQNDATGLYWQGRYYLPLLVGVPLVLGSARFGRGVAQRIGWATAGVGLVVVNVALAATMRRFGVGIGGSYLPTDWDTYGAPLPPIVLLVVHAGASIGLLVWGARFVSGSEDGGDDLGDAPHPLGVNVVGYHHVASGLGEIAREIRASLEAASVPCIAVDIVATDSPELRPADPAAAAPYETTIAVLSPTQLPGAMAALPTVASATDRLIGYWFWELSTVPPEHRYAIDQVDEIWAPTEFVRSAYAEAIGRSGPPVRLVPTNIPCPTVDDSDVDEWRNQIRGDAEGAVVFLVSLDLLSVVERKNPGGAVDAFREAFGGRDDVRLVVKTINGDRRPGDLARIAERADADPRILVIDRFVTAPELDTMIAAADVYVSLHRSEGLGLHMATAMWLGTPVLATRYSGNLDLMDDRSAALVDARMVPVRNGGGAYPENASWAEPDHDQAVDWMRRLADDPALGSRLAAAARIRMTEQPTRTMIGEAMAAALGSLEPRGTFTP